MAKLDLETPLAGLIFRFFLASSAAYFFYLVFFHYSSLIWAVNPILPLEKYTPWMRSWVFERDGVEPYVLYAMMYCVIGAALLADYAVSKAAAPGIKKILFPLAGLLSLHFYFIRVFHAPANAFRFSAWGALLVILAAGFSLILASFGETKKWLLPVFFAVLFAFCMIPSDVIAIGDYGYIITPALRILHGFKLSETYFQYDYLLSLLAALWIKLNLSAYAFYLTGSLSSFALCAGIYCLAARFFLHRRFAFYLLAAFAVVHLFGNIRGGVVNFQVTPLRLDWWLPVLAAAYWKGPRHWLTGLLLGFLLLFHHAFGLIYALAYVALTAVLAAFEFTDGGNISVPRLRLYAVNLSMIAAAFLSYKLFLAPAGGAAMGAYAKYGIGFLPIARNSVYWPMPAVFAMVFMLLRKNKKLLSERYFQTAVFMTLLAIGNSLYFFGRSHENNIVNIAASLLFVLFTFFDLADFELNIIPASRINRLLVPALATGFLLAVTCTYSPRAVGKIRQQYLACKNLWFILDPKVPVGEIRALTASSSRVIFLSLGDFPYYYEGGYVPQGYYSFTGSWLFAEDYTDFLNRRLAKGYYLVSPISEFADFKEIVSKLRYKSTRETRNFIALTNNPAVYRRSAHIIPDCAIDSEDREGGWRGDFDGKFGANSRSYSRQILQRNIPPAAVESRYSIAQFGIMTEGVK
ncbi:MAG: hypothetical protein PHP45_07840 [Elusimicrobiales bacterium]|nr:hypothetical protein [Elusimicrobiales bacterium]